MSKIYLIPKLGNFRKNPEQWHDSPLRRNCDRGSIASRQSRNRGPTTGDGVVNYSATKTPTATNITTDAGSLVDDNGVFKIEAAGGRVRECGIVVPRRRFRLPDCRRHNDRIATLTPHFDLAHAVYQPVALPFDDTALWKTDGFFAAAGVRAV